MQPTGFRKQFTAIADALAFAQGIVDTVREPVLVLDQELRVIAANRSFYSVFKVSARGHPRQTSLCVGRRPMGHSKAPAAAGKNHAREGRDGGLRGRARVSRPRTPHDVLERTAGVLRGRRRHDHSARHRGRHRAARPGARKGRVVAAEGRVARGTAASDRQQPANHRQHHSAEGDARCSRKRRVFICTMRTSGSCRSPPCSGSCMRPGPPGRSKLRLTLPACARPLRRR